MLLPLAFAALAASTSLSTACPATPSSLTRPDSLPDLAATWRDGVSFAEFVGAMKTRPDEWRKRSGWAAIPDTLAARAKAVRGPFRILAVAEEMCGDSMSSIPYLAKLVDLAPALNLRIVDSKRGRLIMEAHRTPDGRAATPTVVVIDATDHLVACWTERPIALLQWSRTPKDSLPPGQRFAGRMAWYDDNKGRAALSEIVERLERADRGDPACP